MDADLSDTTRAKKNATERHTSAGRRSYPAIRVHPRERRYQDEGRGLRFLGSLRSLGMTTPSPVIPSTARNLSQPAWMRFLDSLRSLGMTGGLRSLGMTGGLGARHDDGAET